MGFFDKYEDDGAGLDYIDEIEKATLIKNGTPVKVLRIWKGEGEYGEKFTVVVDLEGEERAMSFSATKVPSRVRMLSALMEYLETEDAEPPSVVIYKVKNAQLLRNADEEV